MKSRQRSGPQSASNYLLKIYFCIALSAILSIAVQARAEEPAKTWSLDPFVDYGIVYQFTEHITTYSGGGISARWTPGPWAISARWRSDEYEITYYGITNETAQALFTNQPLPGPLLTQIPVRERKEERELLFGGQAWGKGLSLFAGMRQVRLLNSFLSMNIFGPALKAESCLSWGDKNILLAVGGVLDRNGTVRNHRDDYIISNGEKTISFYGQLRGVADWSAMIESQPHSWGRLRFGYEGAVMSFKYGDRYFHGLVLKLAY